VLPGGIVFTVSVLFTAITKLKLSFGFADDIIDEMSNSNGK